MSKKEKIELQHSDVLEAFDSELTDAMKHLDETIERVSDVLGTFAPPEPDQEPNQTDPNAGAPNAAADSTEEAGAPG